MAQAILRLPAVAHRVGLSRSTIYLRIKQNTFPKPINLGGRAVGWLESDVEEWLDRMVSSSRGASVSESKADDGVEGKA